MTLLKMYFSNVSHVFELTLTAAYKNTLYLDYCILQGKELQL